VSKEIAHASFLRRVAIMVGAGHVPGLNAVVMGTAVRCGKPGMGSRRHPGRVRRILHPERYPDGGLVALDPGSSPTSTRTARASSARPRASIRSTSAA